MAIPKLDAPECNSSENDIKLYHIMYALNNMSYYVDDARDVVRIIEKYALDKSQFDYPYGSFDEFKKHTLSGDFDVDENDHVITEQRRKELAKAVKDGKLWITY